MKRKNIIIFVLAFILIVLPNASVYAAEPDSVTGSRTVTSKLIFSVHYVEVSAHNPYISKTFIPTAKQLSVIFTSYDGTVHPTSGNTFYIEKMNSNGSWTIVGRHYVQGASSLSTSEFVEPYQIYRVRVATTNSTTNRITMEVSEIIVD
ncbi:MAG: hypothetical protein K2L86_10910 [Lachnospiraceae bacterium]|nr:hypothetical protein [Lachnospiraceae bacterium]